MPVVRKLSFLLLAFLLLPPCINSSYAKPSVKKTIELEALPRMLRVDLIWPNMGEGLHYDVERAQEKNGPFSRLEHITPTVHLFSDYIGEAGITYYYRVRCFNPTNGLTSAWSTTASATSSEFECEGFLTEVQEAGFRYFYNYAYPGSHLPREGIKAKKSWHPKLMSVVSTGMYFFNIACLLYTSPSPRDEL